MAIQYRPNGTSRWKVAQPLWWDALSAIPEYKNQYRGSIVNLVPGNVYNIAYSLDGGVTWVNMANVQTRLSQHSGTTVNYSGTLTSKLVITDGGTSTNWRVHDGQGSTVIDPDHTADCVQIKASYVILRGFNIRDCKYMGITVEKPNVIVERNTIEDWGSQEIAFDNPKPRFFKCCSDSEFIFILFFFVRARCPSCSRLPRLLPPAPCVACLVRPRAFPPPTPLLPAVRPSRP